MTSNREQLYFEAVKEHRGSYFVEYQPPFANNAFATINVVFPGPLEIATVAELMRSEMLHWMTRYPVPVMISAFDATENVIKPNGDSDSGFLFGWFLPDEAQIKSSWKLDELPAFFNDIEDLPDWRIIYKDVPFRTDAQIKSTAKQNLERTRKQNRILKYVIVLWLVLIPATWASIQYFGPEWLATAVYIYALWQAIRAWRKLNGKVKPTRSEAEKAEKERKMDHYFYHCERNPDGFSRLKRENFERDNSERTRKDAEELATKAKERI